MNRGWRRTASGLIRFPVNTGGLCTAPKEEKGNACAGAAYSAAMRAASDQGSRATSGRRDALLRVNQGEIGGVEPLDAAKLARRQAELRAFGPVQPGQNLNAMRFQKGLQRRTIFTVKEEPFDQHLAVRAADEPALRPHDKVQGQRVAFFQKGEIVVHGADVRGLGDEDIAQSAGGGAA